MMKLEILKTYITCIADGHDVVPDNFRVGDFHIKLDDTDIIYGHEDFYNGYNVISPVPIIQFKMKGRTVIHAIDSIYPNNNILDFENIPKIKNISNINYVAFSEKNYLQTNYDFDIVDFCIVVEDIDTHYVYEIHASQDIINNYNNKIRKERLVFNV